MVPALHALEVTLRNNLFAASLKIVGEQGLQFREVQCWLDAEPSLLYQKEEENVEQAKELLRKGGRPLTPGRLISKLGFGFWVSLCRSPYEQGRVSGPALWPKLTQLGFHHEPIWDRNLDRAHARVIDTLSWMNNGVAKAVADLSRVDPIFAKGPEAFRTDVERLMIP